MYIPTTTLTQGSVIELAYVEFTAPVTISGTTFGTANTVVSAGAVTYDGTVVWIEFHTNLIEPNASAGAVIRLGLAVDGTDIGQAWFTQKDNSTSVDRGVTGCFFKRKYTPSAGSHTILVYGFQAGGNGSVNAGAGGAAAFMPGYIRITRNS